MSGYNFDTTLLDGRIQIDTAAGYGCWERADGSEGGGLWFDGDTLTDYDGAACLPMAILAALHKAGYNVTDHQ